VPGLFLFGHSKFFSVALAQALTVMVDAGGEQREGDGRWLFGGVRTRISRLHLH